MKCSCPHCGQHLEAEEDMAGMTVACPVCAKELTIPGNTAPKTSFQPTDELRAVMKTILDRARAHDRKPGSVGFLETISILAFLTMPIAGWLLFWLLWDFRWWTGLLLGGFCGFIAGTIFMAIGMSISSGQEEKWTKRLVTTASWLFDNTYTTQHPHRPAAIATLCEMGLAEPDPLIPLLLESIQPWQKSSAGVPPQLQSQPDIARSSIPGIEGILNAIALEMEPFFNKPYAYKPFKTGLDSDSTGFHGQFVHLSPGENVTCTFDPFQARSANSLGNNTRLS